jgi:hypothetical protein
MNTGEAFRVHQAAEYIRHRVDCGEEFGWDVEDVEEELPAVLAFYGFCYEDFSEEGISVLMTELEQLAEAEQDREIVRIFA